METFKIKAILSAVKHKSLSKAAEEFSYTPSAFSHLLNNFEDELGVKLFERTSKGVILSDNGEKLFEAFKDVKKAEDRVWKIISNIKGTDNTELRIASYSSMSRNMVSGVIKRLRKEFPHIKITVSVADNVTGWIEDDKADVVFADISSFGNSEWLPLFKDEFCVVAPHNYFKDKTAITVDELYNHPYIFAEGFNIEKHIDNNRFKEILHFNSEDDLSIINAVKDGFGLAVLTRLVIKGYEREVDVLKLEPQIMRTLGVAYNKEKMLKLGLMNFIKSIG